MNVMNVERNVECLVDHAIDTRRDHWCWGAEPATRP